MIDMCEAIFHYRIVDTEENNSFDLAITTIQLSTIRYLQTLAYILYGGIIAITLFMLQVPINIAIIVLILAYVINMIVAIYGRFYSPSEYIHIILAYPILIFVFKEPINKPKCDLLRLCMQIYYSEEYRLFRNVIVGEYK
jgi:hypothetical protein